MQRAGFEPAQNLSSGFVKYAVARTTIPRRHIHQSISMIVRFRVQHQ